MGHTSEQAKVKRTCVRECERMRKHAKSLCREPRSKPATRVPPTSSSSSSSSQGRTLSVLEKMKQSQANHAAHVAEMKHHTPTENFNSGQHITSSGGPLSNLDSSRYYTESDGGSSTSGTAHTVMEEMKKRHEQHGKGKGKGTQHLNEMNL